MGLRFDPVGGGQFKQAVQQIIEAESQPLKTLEARKAKEESRLKLFNEFKSKFENVDKALSELSSFRKFRELKVDSGDGSSIIDLTVDKERAEPGQYQLEVNQLASRFSVISNGFESPDEALLGPGFIAIPSESGEMTEIYVDDKSSSLKGIASKINNEEKCPVRAAVIKDSSDSDAPWRLILSGKDEGKSNQIEFPEFYFSDSIQDLVIEDNKDANNGQIVMNGFPIEIESNELKDFLPGVNLHVKEARPEHSFTVSITEDHQKVTGKIKTLIDQLNQILQFINKQNAVDEKTDTSTTFAGDTSLQTMEFKIRNLIHQPFSGGTTKEGANVFVNLSELGVEFDKTGLISFKEQKFTKAMESHFEPIAQAITGSDGFASQMRFLFDGFTRSGDGTLKVKESGLRDRIKDIDKRIEDKTRQLERRKQDVIDKFARLQSTLGDLQRQQQYMSSVLPSGGGNLISQLLG